MLKPPQIRAALLVLFVCAFGILQSYRPTLLSAGKRWQADGIDSRLNHYFLEHGYRCVFQKEYAFTFWSPGYFYPFPNSLALSENLVGSAPVYWMWRFVFSPATAHVLWQITVQTMTFVALFWLSRRWGLRAIPAAAAAYIFAFGLPRLAQLGDHVQLLAAFYAPLSVYGVWSFFRRPALRWVALGTLGWVLQLAAGIYLGMFLGIALPVFFLALLLVDGDGRRRILVFLRTKTPAAAAVFVGCMVPAFVLMAPYMRMARALPSGWSPSMVEVFLPRLSSYINILPFSFWSALIHYRPPLDEIQEHYLFPGFVPFIGLLLVPFVLIVLRRTVRSDHRKLMLASVATSLTLTFLSLRFPNGSCLWPRFAAVVPGLSSIRAVGRIWTASYLFLLPAAFLAIQYVLSRKRPAHRPFLEICLLLLVLGEQTAGHVRSVPKASFKTEEDVLTELASGAEVVYLQLGSAKIDPQLLSIMWAGMRSGVPVVNGSSSQNPPGYLEPALRPTPRQVAGWLRGHGIDVKSVRFIFANRALVDEECMDAVSVSSNEFVVCDVPWSQLEELLDRPTSPAPATPPEADQLPEGQEATADYNGDGILEEAVYVPAGGHWYIRDGTGNVRHTQWGWHKAMAVPGDYDGDGRDDIAVYNPDEGTWHILPSRAPLMPIIKTGRGHPCPVPADYDFDGRIDPAVRSNDVTLVYSSLHVRLIVAPAKD